MKPEGGSKISKSYKPFTTAYLPLAGMKRDRFNAVSHAHGHTFELEEVK